MIYLFSLFFLVYFDNLKTQFEKTWSFTKNVQHKSEKETKFRWKHNFPEVCLCTSSVYLLGLCNMNNWILYLKECHFPVTLRFFWDLHISSLPDVARVIDVLNYFKVTCGSEIVLIITSITKHIDVHITYLCSN